MSKRYKMTEKDIETIQKFVDSIPYDDITEYIEIERGYRYSTCIEDANIQVGSKRLTIYDQYFNEFTQRRFGEVFNHVVIAILHEVGHIMTQDINNSIARAMLEVEYADKEEAGIIDNRQHNFAYFEFPSEIQATTWAVNYYRTHREKCENLKKALDL